MERINIEPGSYLHGILNSEFDNGLLFRYNDLLKEFADIISGHDAEQNNRVISTFVNAINVHIADNERVINDLKIVIDNEIVQKGFVSNSQIKLNNLQTIVSKAKCLIIDLKLMTENRSDISNIDKTNSDYTVKSIIMAYYYMRIKEIYPIPELSEGRLPLKKILNELTKLYGFSYHSFRNDWTPFGKKEKRITQPENIKLAIKLLETFDYPNIKEAIKLANHELREAELLKN